MSSLTVIAAVVVAAGAALSEHSATSDNPSSTVAVVAVIADAQHRPIWELLRKEVYSGLARRGFEPLPAEISTTAPTERQLIALQQTRMTDLVLTIVLRSGSAEAPFELTFSGTISDRGELLEFGMVGLDGECLQKDGNDVISLETFMREVATRFLIVLLPGSKNTLDPGRIVPSSKS